MSLETIFNPLLKRGFQNVNDQTGTETEIECFEYIATCYYSVDTLPSVFSVSVKNMSAKNFLGYITWDNLNATFENLFLNYKVYICIVPTRCSDKMIRYTCLYVPSKTSNHSFQVIKHIISDSGAEGGEEFSIHIKAFPFFWEEIEP